MKQLHWKVQFRSVGYVIVGIFLVAGVSAQRAEPQGRPSTFQTFPVPQSFQQLRIITPTGDSRPGHSDVTVNQFSHQFFHPVPAPSTQQDRRLPPSGRPPPSPGPSPFSPSRSDPAARAPIPPPENRGRAIKNQDFTLEAPVPRRFPDFEAAPFRPDTTVRKVFSPESTNTIRPSERTKPVEDSTRFSNLVNKRPTPEEEFFGKINSDFDRTADFFEKNFQKPSVRPIDGLSIGTRPVPVPTTERDRSTNRIRFNSAVAKATTTTTTPAPEEEDYYVYYDEDDLPEEIRKLLEDDGNQPLVVERITTEIKPTTSRQPPVTTTVTVTTTAPTTKPPATSSERPSGSRIFPGEEKTVPTLTTTERFSIAVEREPVTTVKVQSAFDIGTSKTFEKVDAPLPTSDSAELQSLSDEITSEENVAEEAFAPEINPEPEKRPEPEVDPKLETKPEPETSPGPEKAIEPTTVGAESEEVTEVEIKLTSTVEAETEVNPVEITTHKDPVTSSVFIKEVPDTVAPVPENRDSESVPLRRPFRPSRLRPALSPRRFPDRFSKFSLPPDDAATEAPNRTPSSQEEKTFVSVQTTKSIVSPVTDSPSVLEITPQRPSVDRGSKAIGTQKDPDNILQKTRVKTEDIVDKLDKFQSEFSDSFLFGAGPPLPTVNVSKPVFSYARSPLEIIKDLKVGPPPDESDITPDAEKSTTVSTAETTSEISVTSSTTTLTTVQNSANETDSEKSVVSTLFDRLFGSVKTDNLDGLLPPDFKNESQSPTTTEVTTEESKPTTAKNQPVGNSQDKLLAESELGSVAGLLPPGFELGITSTGRSIDSAAPPKDPLAGLLPPGFKVEPVSEDSLAGLLPLGFDIEAVSKDPLAGILPPGFGGEKGAIKVEPVPIDSLAGLLPPGFKLEEKEATTNPLDGLFVEDDISKFLPKDFKTNRFASKATSQAKPVAAVQESEQEGPKTKLIFPTRAGKVGASSTTTKPLIAKPTTEAITIKQGWPVRATTEFTGWPSPSTTPRVTVSTEATTTTTTEMTTTTLKSTTTKPYIPVFVVDGICIHTCKVAASLRVVEGIDWSAELANPITSEYRDLVTLLKVQLDGVYRSSALAQFYRGVDIEGFSPGSVIVDYYVHFALPSSNKALNATDIRTLFHQALSDGAGGLHFGNFSVDPRASSFVVQMKDNSDAIVKPETDTSLLPSWAIAIIAIGLLSLLFVVSFGVTMLVRRRRVNQVKKGIPLSEEMLNELNKTSEGLDNYAMEDPYDLGPLPPDPWDDLSKIGKPRLPPARRPASSTGIPNRNARNFNPGIYDSWKSEWNGQLASYASATNQHFSPGSSYSLSRDLIPNASLRRPELPTRPGSSLANRFNMVHEWGRGFTNTTVVNNYTSEWVAAAAGRNSRLGLDGGWSHSVLNGSNRSSATRTLRRPTDYDPNEF